MRFIAEYTHRKIEQPNYFRTVFADSVNEASKEAEKYTRKGFLCKSVTQQIGGLQ